MSSQEISIKHSALGWVKKSIDDNLSEIKNDLKLYIETTDGARLESVKEGLGIIQGVLVMIEQYGAAMLTEEMVALTDFVAENKSSNRGEQALEVMLRAVLQLPDYLEHIQSGYRDIPIAILPLLNDIRSVRDQDLFSEKLLFLPDLTMHQEDAKVQTIDKEANEASKLLIKKLRPAYQLALVNVIKEQSVEESLKRIEKVCETLEERSASEQIARIWWIVGALVESVSRQQLELGVSIKNLLGKVDALFRVILIIGEGGLLKRQPIDLIKNFLYYIAQPECDGPKAQAIKIAYRLEQFLPSESARSEVLDNIAGPNQALLKTVAEAMKTDIESVKSTLEVYVNGDLARVEELEDLPMEMHVISDTLAMIGLGSQRQLIEAQAEVVREILAGNQVADEEQLLSMAAELLQVEHALDQMQKRQPVDTSQSETDISRDYELDSVLTAVVTAALDDIQKAKNAILEFIKDSSRSENIELCIALMEESRGALQLLNQHRAATVVEGLLAYLKYCDIVDFMDSKRLDALSQVVVSLEYYLESLGEHRSDVDSILDAADGQLQELLNSVKINSESDRDDQVNNAGESGEQPDGAVTESAGRGEPSSVVPFPVEKEVKAREAHSIETAEAGETDPDADSDRIVVEDVVKAESDIVKHTAHPKFQPASAADEALTTEVETISVTVEKPLEIVSVDEELDVLKAGSDPEILEIYLEEAEEESQNIVRLQQDWLLHPEDENAVKNIRRAFHTIKGSGRLVGAIKIGEFAWDFEQLLNRVIDKTIPPDRRVIDAVGEAAEALAELVEELKTLKPPKSDISELRGLARALAEFKAERLLYEHTRRASDQDEVRDRLTQDEEVAADRQDADGRGFGVGATTQVIPPGKATEAMLDDIEPDTVQVDSGAFEVTQAQHGSEEPSLDDTLLAQPPQVPELEGYTPAVDYARDFEDSSPTDLSEREEFRETIQIETIGEDFLGNDFGEDFGEEGELQTTDSPAGEILPEVDSSPDIDSPADEVPEPLEQISGESLPTAGRNDDEARLAAEDSIEEFSFAAEETELEEAAMLTQTSALTGGEGVREIPESEVDVEEIVMQGAESDSDANPQAVEINAEEIEFEAPEFVVEDIEVEASTADSEALEEQLESQPADADPVQSAAQEIDDGEDSPDPLAEMKMDQMPGSEAEGVELMDQGLPEQTDLSFDPELLTIYRQEVEQYLSIVSSELDQAEQHQELNSTEEFYRALHTIHGASRTADISTIGELAGLMEKPLKLAISQKLVLDDEIIALYREGQQALSSMTEELATMQRLPEIPAGLKISLIALADDLKEYSMEIVDDEAEPVDDFINTLTSMSTEVDSGHDHELLSIFVDEANELLEMSDNTLHEWSRQEFETGSQDYGSVMELQRYLHTLKGGARMAELTEISDLSHEMESMFIAVIDGRVGRNDGLIELLKDCFDLLHRQVVEAQEGRDMSDCSELVGLLKDLRSEEGENFGAEPDDDNAVVETASHRDSDVVAEHLSAELMPDLEKPSQDVIKVRSDLLDNLVNAAGEVSIYRARMEQQVAGLGSHLGELGQTIARLKNQLRNLEAETDAQIHYSHRSESGQIGEFDPLEMDRYTMIQELSRSLSESVNDLSSLQSLLGEQVKDSETLLLQQSRVNTDLQDGLIKSRMVRFSGLLSRLRRLVRQSSQELGKKAELTVSGEENEVDNKVLDRMVAPLEHIIRNALSHGIETPVERVKKGKAESGRIAIDIARDGSDIVIRVSDDGAGVNIEKVRSRAIQLGLLEQSHEVSDADLVQYILEPGFSTAEHVTQMSGRGIGMDVVDIEIKQLGGTLQIETNPQGTTFVARLPFTLSINQAILVRTSEEVYAIPLNNIEGITRLNSRQMQEYYQQDEPELEYAGQRFALHNLSALVGLENAFRADADDDKQAVILSRSGDVRVALHVDEIIGNREIVVKTLGKQLSQVKALAGASILADGNVVLILDINGLIRHSAANAVKIVYQPGEEQAATVRSMVMVVDDSITMRRVASKLLERHNYQVVTAKDGVDALAQLQDLRPDVMLLDIEMPRMDGFELAAHMQNEESFARIPIIMITSRTGEKHRDRALEIGVNNYMGKPYQEEELIENIQTALEAG